MLESYVEKWPTHSIENFRYMLRSGMMGWFTIMLDTTSWSTEQHTAARQEIDLYKKELRSLSATPTSTILCASGRRALVCMQYWDRSAAKASSLPFTGRARKRRPTHFSCTA